MINSDRTFKWWMGPVVGAGAGFVLWLKVDNPKHDDQMRILMLIGTVLASTLAGAILAALDLMRLRSVARFQAGGPAPLSALGYFFVLAGLLFCLLPVAGPGLNLGALYATRGRRGWLRKLSWLALALGIATTIAAIALVCDEKFGHRR